MVYETWQVEINVSPELSGIDNKSTVEEQRYVLHVITVVLFPSNTIPTSGAVISTMNSPDTATVLRCALLITFLENNKQRPLP